MAENSNFQTLYLLDGLSFVNNFFAFPFISASSCRIMYFSRKTEKWQFALIKHGDVIYRPKTDKIKRNRNNDCLELNVLLLGKVWAPSDKRLKSFSKCAALSPLRALCETVSGVSVMFSAAGQLVFTGRRNYLIWNSW